MQAHEAGAALFVQMPARLAAWVLQVVGGAIVDAAVTGAGQSTNNQRGERDSKVHQNQKAK